MIIYILIGIFFMFCIEFLLSKENFKKQISTNLGTTERVLGILFWPICLGVFLYNFFKTFFK